MQHSQLMASRGTETLCPVSAFFCMTRDFDRRLHVLIRYLSVTEVPSRPFAAADRDLDTAHEFQ